MAHEETVQGFSASPGQEKIAINRERARRRREVARTVRSARYALETDKGPRPGFEAELLTMYAEARISSAYAIPMFILIVASIAMLWIEAAMIGIWVISTVSLHSVGAVLAARFLNEQSTRHSLRYWRNLFTFWDFVYGLSWAGLVFLPHASDDIEGLEVFQFATVLVFIAMRTMQASTLPRTLLSSTLSITLALALVFFTHHTPIHYAMAAMVVGAQGFFLVLGNQLLNTSINMLAYRAEKDHLIAELEQANALSDESRRRAEEANLAKSRFLATMSHELRTPLNAILGFSEVMKDQVLGPLDNPTYREYAGDIHSSGSHLLHLINEILDISRIEAGRYELHEEAVLLTDIVDDCMNMTQIKAQSKQITLTERHARDLTPVWVDERAIRQVILNLLSNAVKFTPTKGRVEITVEWGPSGGQLVSVRDTGPGIPEDEIPIVLQAFGQGSVAIQSAEQGTGLGLSIVQALIGQHGGTFELKSKLREGTEVIISIPANRVLEAVPPKTHRNKAKEPVTPARVHRKAS